MTTYLQDPWRPRRRLADDGQVVVATAPTNLAHIERHQLIIGETNVVEQLETAGGQRRVEQLTRGLGLGGSEVAESQAFARHDADWQVRPVNGGLPVEWPLEFRPLGGAERHR